MHPCVVVVVLVDERLPSKAGTGNGIYSRGLPQRKHSGSSSAINTLQPTSGAGYVPGEAALEAGGGPPSALVGAALGPRVGRKEGASEGMSALPEGTADGRCEGGAVSALGGCALGCALGWAEGAGEGAGEGSAAASATVTTPCMLVPCTMQ
jgi:hypothetical protein